MKKYLLLSSILFLAGCHSMDRIVESYEGGSRGGSGYDDDPNVPLKVPNGSFEIWDLLGPTEWEATTQGSPAPDYNLQKVTDSVDGLYAMKENVTSVGSGVTDGVSFIVRFNPDNYKGHSVRMSAWCKTSTANTWRITFKTGVSNVYGTIASGSGQWQQLVVEGFVDPSAPLLWLKIGCLAEDVKVSSVIWDDAKIEVLP